MEIEKNVINSIQDNTYFCIKNLSYSKFDLMSVYKEFENELVIDNSTPIETILFNTGLITDKIMFLQYDNAFKLQMMELLYLVTFKRIIEVHNISQADFDFIYPRAAQLLIASPRLDNKREVSEFVMVMYSVFLSEVIKKLDFKEAMINVHRFYISFKR